MEEENQTKIPEEKKSSKKPWVGLAILVAIIAGLVVGWKVLSAEESTETKLAIETGQVEVNGKSGKNGQVLVAGDTVKTLPASQATVAFPEGTEIRLDEKTEIKIKTTDEKISIFQSLGRTWSRVVNLLGAADYEVETSNMIASVRGTAFNLENDENQTDLDVDDGSVTAKNETGQTNVEKDGGATSGKGRGQIVRRAMRAELRESDWARRNRDLDMKLLERIRKRASSPRQVLRALREVSPDDIAKLKGLAARAQAGGVMISEAQANQLENLDLRTPSGIAQALYIIDPQNFSDTQHWSRVMRILIPFVQRFGVEKVLQTNE